jgi:hypothetical protein
LQVHKERDMKISWRTAWQGQDIVVWREDDEVDRIPAAQIEKVVFVHREGGESPTDLVHALVQMKDDWLVLPPETGFAGRVHFERHAFWTEKACVFWVDEAHAPLPLRLRRGRIFRREPLYTRAPRDEMDAAVERWPLEGPQTWEQRKWHRIEARRPFSPLQQQERRRA